MKFTNCVTLVGSKPKRYEGTKRYVSTGALAVDHIDEESVELVGYEDRPSRADLTAESGDVLFAKMADTKKTILLDKENAENIYSTGFFAVRAKPGMITAECLYYLLTSDVFLRQKNKHSSGATQRAITNKGLEAIDISIPNLDEQTRLVAKLDALSKVIKSREQQLAELDNLIKARFVELFGDSKVNPYGFNKVRLEDSCEIVTGNTPSRTVNDYYGDYIEWIKTDNIMAEMMYPTRATESLSEVGLKVGRYVEKGAILMACIAGSVASIGKVCITDRQVAFNQQINAIVPKKYNALFLYVLLQTSKDYLVEELNMALKGILSKSKLGEKTFILPPMDQQNAFAAFVAQIDKSKVVVQKALSKNVQYFTI
jgi:type I restriction enzyme S subunit